MTASRSKQFALALLAILVAAALLRLVRVDHVELNNREADAALQAYQLSAGEPVTIGAQSGYVLLTSQVFALFGSSTFLARLIPVLAGILLVVAAGLYTGWIGALPALALAAGLALDPTLVTLSRQAGGVMLAVGCGFLAGGLWLRRRPVLAGISLALALMGGPDLWPGLVCIVLAGLLVGPAHLFEQINTLRGENPAEGQTDPGVEKKDLQRLGIAAAVTLFLVGTLFFRHPNGLSAILSSLPAYIARWTDPSLAPDLARLPWLLSLLFYAPIPLLLGLIGGLRGWTRGGQDYLDRFLFTWAILAGLTGLINPSRQISDLAWVVLPLWTLAARELFRHVNLPVEDRFPVLGQTAITAILGIFAWVVLARIIVEGSPEQLSGQYRWLILFGAFTLTLLTVALIGWAWSPAVAGKGVLWGWTAVMLLYTLAATTAAGGLRQTETAELLRPTPQPEQTSLMVTTLGDLSEWNTGERRQIDVLVSGLQFSSLDWLLRDFPHAAEATSIPAGSMPSVVITSGQVDQPALAASYRGQDFTYFSRPDWSHFEFIDWLSWLIDRQAPRLTDPVILWARADLFPGSALTGQNP